MKIGILVSAIDVLEYALGLVDVYKRQAVLLTRTTLPAASKEHMSPAASCLRNVSNVPS